MRGPNCAHAQFGSRMHSWYMSKAGYFTSRFNSRSLSASALLINKLTNKEL